ncbi:carbohydrate porin [Entomomonas asaccharolytica]|uniref:Carbohydrate porin n=1 Tax=Entomomonas asaccharolytica TaxID=2785331 RepID=A0A974NHV3_9GAMM|nr:carbohydrate porin [Entomomonas asaccharolytica]QQP86754.1 carbohydrate porin [Entomomonas asaccharolytica]
MIPIPQKTNNYLVKTLVAIGLHTVLFSPIAQAKPFDIDSPWMLGDWGGVRSDLEAKGYQFSFEYLSEASANLGGGYNNDRTARYADQWTLVSHLDLEKILGLPNAEFQTMITSRNGRSLSGDRLSDPRTGQFSNTQEIYGRGQTVRLSHLWYQQKFFDRLIIKAGRYGVGDDFNTFAALGCEFQNLAFCGSQVGNWTNSWYNGPIGQWAANIKYNFTPELAFQIGAFEQNPSLLEKSNGFKLNGSGGRGALFPMEFIWTPKLGENGLPGEYRAGYFYTSANQDDVYKDEFGSPIAITGNQPKSRGSRHAWWLLGQQQITSYGKDTSRGLVLFAGLSMHDRNTNVITNSQFIGGIYKGPFDFRPKDSLGLAITRIDAGSRARRGQQLANAIYQANNGMIGYDNPSYTPIQRTEYNTELYYAFDIAKWLSVRPNLQYVKNPGGVTHVRNAVVGGLEIRSKF